MSERRMISIFVMGKRYEVPEGLTILKALEYAGYRLIRGCGCRAGFCGACATVYRIRGEPKLRVALACQTLAQPNMCLTQLTSFPAPAASLPMDEISDPGQAVLELHPELVRCLGCGTCTRACPQELEVTEYVAAILRGDIERATELSFDCLSCGLCAARCPMGIVPYSAALFVRRAYALSLQGDEELRELVAKIRAGELEAELDRLVESEQSTLRKLFEERDFQQVKRIRVKMDR